MHPRRSVDRVASAVAFAAASRPRDSGFFRGRVFGTPFNEGDIFFAGEAN